MTTNKSLEDRIRAIEDRLEIYNLIASHPPSADTAGKDHIAASWCGRRRVRPRRESLQPAWAR